MVEAKKNECVDALKEVNRLLRELRSSAEIFKHALATVRSKS